MGAITLALAGCFAEPPGNGGGGSSTTGDEGSSSGTSAGGTTGVDAESSSGSADTIDPDTGSSSSTVTGDEPECSLDLQQPVETGRVPADVVVIVGEMSSVPDGFLSAFGATTSVAVIAEEAVVAGLEADVDETCRNGCGGCNTPNRSLLPYAAGALGGAFGAFLGEQFECVFRPPPPAQELSTPSRQLWLFTQSPNLPIPVEIESRMLTLGLRLHVACPGCGVLPEDWEDSDLGRLVVQTQGSIGDSDGVLVGQRDTLTAARTSCVWADDDPPDAFLIDNGFADRDEPFFASNGQDLGFDECEELFEKDGQEVLFPLFFPNDDDTVELCPIACRLAQLPEADDTELFRCD